MTLSNECPVNVNCIQTTCIHVYGQQGKSGENKLKSTAVGSLNSTYIHLTVGPCVDVHVVCVG